MGKRPKKPKLGKERVLDREFFAEARRKGWAHKSEAERKAVASNAGRAYWDALSPEERSTEMKRRAAKRKKKK